MSLTFDSWFAIGTSHMVCEDYAADWPDMAALSDGCSGSDDTDIGARLLVMGARQCRRRHLPRLRRSAGAPQPRRVEHAAARADAFRRALRLPSSCLDATLGVLEPIEDWGIRAVLAGDGLIAFQHANGTRWIEVEYPGGAPGYPVLTLSEAQSDRYLRAYPQGRVRRAFHDGDAVGGSTEAGADCLAPIAPVVLRETHRAVFVFSDGIFTIRDADGRPVPVADALAEFMAVRPAPCFQRRRMQGALRKRKWTHADDLSVIAVCITPDRAGATS